MLMFWHWLLHLDVRLFYFLNTQLICYPADQFFVWITNEHHWILPLLLLWIGLVWKGGAKGRWLALGLLLAVGLSDFLTGHILKPWIGRLRPCKTLEGIRLLVFCGGRFSFPSSHATNAATMAGLISLAYPRWRWLAIPIAFLVGYSRVYVGVHYPLDVLGGFLLGTAIAFLFYWIIFYRILRKREDTLDKPDHS